MTQRTPESETPNPPPPSRPVPQELVCPGAEPRWSLAELIHAVILMAHAHSLCSFVWGCGLNPEPDHSGGHTFRPPSPSPSHVQRSPHSPAHEDGRQEVSRSLPGRFSAVPASPRRLELSEKRVGRLCVCLLQLADGAMEVEVLMKRMAELQQQQEEEECSQEEMVTRFERERSESIPTGTYAHRPQGGDVASAGLLTPLAFFFFSNYYYIYF